MNFNTTVCVGSSLIVLLMLGSRCCISIQLFVSVRETVVCNVREGYIFQYNCLCRFEVVFENQERYATLFQYNCLCRFEITIQAGSLKILYFNTTVCVGSSFQFVDIHRSFLIDFNTTVCVGSRRCELVNIDAQANFNTTVCVGSRSAELISIRLFIIFQYNCLCRFEF